MTAAASLDDDRIGSLVELRHRLHRAPERSGRERATASTIVSSLATLAPDELLTELGGHGVAALLRGTSRDACPIVIRCELDALPIEEAASPPHASTHAGTMHACGHDGHMVMTLGAGMLQRDALAAGAHAPPIALLFQPAEETGAGAAAVIADGRLDRWSPAAALAVHNMPGDPLGAVIVRDGPFACASCGVRIELRGRSTHAATPEQGRSPADAVATLLSELPHAAVEDHGADGLVTVVHARLGTPDFGVAPGVGLVMATLRAQTDAMLDALRSRVERRVRDLVAAAGIEVVTSWHDAFPAVVNGPVATDAVRDAARHLGHPVIELETPVRFSEDFARLIGRYGGAMYGLGAGHGPPLHDPAYDFPDALIPMGASLLFAIATRLASSETDLRESST